MAKRRLASQRQWEKHLPAPTPYELPQPSKVLLQNQTLRVRDDITPQNQDQPMSTLDNATQPCPGGEQDNMTTKWNKVLEKGENHGPQLLAVLAAGGGLPIFSVWALAGLPMLLLTAPCLGPHKHPV